MARKATKTILAALKRAGVAIEADDLDKVTEALDIIELQAEEFLSSDEKIVTMAEYREIKDDLIDKNKKFATLKKEHQELKDAVDAGDSGNVRKMNTYKTKLEELEPLVERLLGNERDRWKAAAKSVPKELKTEFKEAKEGEELSNDDLLHNVGKFEEYTRIGAIKATGNGTETKETEETKEKEPGTPRIPAGGKKPKKYTAEELDKMTPAEKLEASYDYQPGDPKRGDA